jgi:6-phosphofructokinase
MKTKAPRKIGILTSGGDSPGINAAIRGIGKAIAGHFNLQLLGFHDGFSGMAHNLIMPLEGEALSGILTTGGTILGTNRDKPYSAEEDGQRVDYTEKILQVYHQHNLDGLICLGGGNTQESAYYLQQKGLNVITLPVTIDNDIPQTDMTVGFNTAMEIAAEAIDRLHSTAFSHHRIIIVEIMGRETGWLTLGAGIAGGADVILIPEIPYDIHKVAEAILERSRRGKRFSLVAVAEGAIAKETLQFFEHARQANRRLRSGEEAEEVEAGLQEIEKRSAGDTLHLANRLQEFTRLQTRVTILGYLQRGGAPSAFDRVLATQLGTACAHLVSQGHYGVMVGIQGGSVKPTPLAQVAGKVKRVPLDHSWVQGARLVGTCLGD